jgi:hypothetical protein
MARYRYQQRRRFPSHPHNAGLHAITSHTMQSDLVDQAPQQRFLVLS